MNSITHLLHKLQIVGTEASALCTAQQKVKNYNCWSHLWTEKGIVAWKSVCFPVWLNWFMKSLLYKYNTSLHLGVYQPTCWLAVSTTLQSRCRRQWCRQVVPLLSPPPPYADFVSTSWCRHSRCHCRAQHPNDNSQSSGDNVSASSFSRQTPADIKSTVTEDGTIDGVWWCQGFTVT